MLTYQATINLIKDTNVAICNKPPLCYIQYYRAFNLITMELTDRELAVRWFDRKSTTEKIKEIKKAGLTLKIEQIYNSDKEWIWRKQQSL